jgi:formylglycine-generating enzyme required for sulfatase activity
MKKSLKLSALIFATVCCIPVVHADVFGTGTNQFTIDFSNIGYAGNSADSTGYGAVGYNYRIGTYEVTIDQFLKAEASSENPIGNGSENVWNSGVTYMGYTMNYGVDAPAGEVSWYEAARFVNWLSSGDTTIGIYQFNESGTVTIDRSYRNANNLAYALPTTDEWYKAAYYNTGTDTYSLYSSGLNTSPDMEGWNYYTNNLNYPLEHGFKPVWEVGSGTNELNGTYDMMGNVWEWVEIDGSTTNIQYGGSAYAAQGYLASSLNDGNGYEADNISQTNYGFRVVAIPEPSTMGIIAFAGIGIFGIRRIFMI